MSITLLLGTYTRQNSQGVYTIQFDEMTQSLSHLTPIADLGNPTYVTTGYKGTVLFAIHQTEHSGGIVTLLKQADHTWLRVDEVLTDGPAPCYVAFDEQRKLLYSANYHTGMLMIYTTHPDGTLTLKQSIQHTGSSVHPNQTTAHAHYFDIDHHSRYLLACDLGTDEVITYAIQDNQFPHVAHTLQTPPGTGPRHLICHPHAPYVYILGELSNTLLVGFYQADSGKIDVIQSISTLPASFKGDSSGAAIRLSQDGRYLYASNRGHDSIVAYHILDNYELSSPIQWINTKGEGPRDFNLVTRDRYLICGHQHTDNLSIFQRDCSTGHLTLISDDTYAPEVVCIHSMVSSD